MQKTSIWKSATPECHFPPLAQDLEADIVIIGGGITGITAARLLSKQGQRVIVLEAREIGSGTTGDSTGNLHIPVDNFLSGIRKKWDQQTASAVANSRREALDMVERTIAEFRLQCGFFRRPQYLMPMDPSQVRQMDQEYETLRNSGLPAEIVHDIPVSIPAKKGVLIPNQAQFNPLAYVRLLARAIASDQCRIFENSTVIEIDDDRATVSTPGGRVRADGIITATHTPKGFNILQTELGPYREYGLAALLKNGHYPEGIFWTLEKPNHSIRSYKMNGTEFLIVIGEHHKTGQQDTKVDYHHNVEDFARASFDIQEIKYRWSAQHYRSADELPYIGKTLGSKNIHIATGFGTNGLLYGPLAASIIADSILKRSNPWQKLYASDRFTPAKSGGEFLKENINVAKQYVRDYLTHKNVGKLEDLKPGDGGLVKAENGTAAVHRSPDDTLTELSPVCTHLGCMVHWNRLEETWDCPCHGSRFGTDGEVLEGPAITALKRKG